jgi:hypothetical protein
MPITTKKKKKKKDSKESRCGEKEPLYTLGRNVN